MYERPSKLFFTILGAITLSVFSLLFGMIMAGAQAGFGLIIAVILLLGSFLLLLFIIITSFVFMIKHIKDKEKDKFPLGHTFNFLFGIFVLFILGYFYLLIFAGIWVILLPFIGA